MQRNRECSRVESNDQKWSCHLSCAGCARNKSEIKLKIAKWKFKSQFPKSLPWPTESVKWSEKSVKIFSKNTWKYFWKLFQVFCFVSVVFNYALITRQLTQIESELWPNMPHSGTNSIFNLLVAFSCCCVVFQVDFAGLFLLCAKKKFDHNFKHRFKFLASVSASASAFTFALAWHLFVAGLRFWFWFWLRFFGHAWMVWVYFFGFWLSSGIDAVIVVFLIAVVVVVVFSSRRGLSWHRRCFCWHFKFASTA